MTKHVSVSRRGIVRLAADADPNKMLADLNRAFNEMKATNDERLKQIEKGREDVVTTEKFDRINADVGALNKAMETISLQINALNVGGGGSSLDPARAEHATAFSKFFRKGVDAGLSELEVKAKLTTQSDPDGGYLVPTEVEKAIDRVLGTVSVMRQLATVMPIGSDTYKKFVGQGGAGSGWVGETAARTETDTPTLRELLFTVMECYANPAATQKMLDDGIVDIAAWLAGEVNIELSELESEAFVVGDGDKKPKGLTAYNKVANASYAWGSVGYVPSGAAGAFVTTTSSASPATAFVDLYYALKSGYRNNASWLMSDATLGKARAFITTTGELMFAPPTAVGEVGTILGKPVYTDDYMPAVAANSYSVAFGDFKRAYLILDRQGIRILRDPYTNKPNVHFYTTKRVGGGIANFEAVKFMKMATS